MTDFSGKVFGIGLSKTGTTSLTVALNDLGIPTIHFPHDPATLEELSTGDFDLSILETYSGITDITVAPFYARLDVVHPDSRFILTVRNPDSWLESIRRHMALTLPWLARDPGARSFTEFIVNATYGSMTFDRERFRAVYDRHTAGVLEYFQDRPDDLLVLDVCAGEGYEKLCPFLGLPVRDEPFPRSNTSLEVERWIGRIDRVRRAIAEDVPPGEPIVLIDSGQLPGGTVPNRSVHPLPERDGVWHGHPPDGDSAVRELRRLEKRGLRYVVVTWPAFWWLEHYRPMGRRLATAYRSIRADPPVHIYERRTEPT